MRARVGFVVGSLVLSFAGCKRCNDGGAPSKRRATPLKIKASTLPPHPSAEVPTGDPVHGLWSQRPFLVRSALLRIHPRWVTLTLIDREAKCDSSRLTENDMGVQLTIPSGPGNDFFTGRDLPIALRLHGAGGISRIPAGHVVARLEPFDPASARLVHGTLRFRFRTASDPDAPVYESKGLFVATVCNNRETEPSMPALPADQNPVAGTVANRPVKLRTMLAYLRDDGNGGQVVMLKGYERDVPCHTTRSATPYLFGAEVGPGVEGKYFVGAPLPTEWILQTRTDAYSERSVHAAHGASWIQLDSVDVRHGGKIRGRLAADNTSDEPAYRFSLSGSFVAKVCGTETKAW